MKVAATRIKIPGWLIVILLHLVTRTQASAVGASHKVRWVFSFFIKRVLLVLMGHEIREKSLKFRHERKEWVKYRLGWYKWYESQIPWGNVSVQSALRWRRCSKQSGRADSNSNISFYSKPKLGLAIVVSFFGAQGIGHVQIDSFVTPIGIIRGVLGQLTSYKNKHSVASIK